MNIENNDKCCFVWSIFAYFAPCNSYHTNRVSNYKQYFKDLNIDGFHFSIGFKWSDVQKFNERNNLFKNIFEINFYQEHNNWRHNLIPIEISKYESDRIIDLAIYKNHYSLFKTLNVFLGDHNKKIICRTCFNSYTSENMLMLQKPKCENNDNYY